MALALNQVNYKDSSSWTSLIDMVYPKGSIFLGYNLMNQNDINSDNHPGKLFGGGWLPIENKMLRSGWGSAAGGNDAHTHVYGSMYVDFYGNLSYPDNSSYSLIVNAAYPEFDTALPNNKKGWISSQILVRPNKEVSSPWTNKGTYNEGGYYYQKGGTTTTSFGLVSRNIPYEHFSNAERTHLTSNTNSSGLVFYGLDGSKPIQIPAYQTVNTWYRTS